MWSDSFDVYETVIFPIVGGVNAGFIVVIVELAFRNLHDRWQQRKAITAIKKLFSEWESKIASADDIKDDQNRILHERSVAQFLHHKYYIKRAPLTLAAWSRNLSEQQTDELTRLIVDHEQVVGIIPGDKVPFREFYDQFFKKAKEIKWLDL